MARSAYEFEDYRSHLADVIAGRPRGEKSRIAEAARCHLAYLSQILSGKAQLSLEQADAISAYLGHSEGEADFFLLLLNEARAGTPTLRARFRKKIVEARGKHAELQNRLHYRQTIRPEHQTVFYSAWYYVAIQLLLMVPGYGTRERIASRLGLPLRRVTEVLTFLEEQGLIEQRDGEYRTGVVSAHLGQDSPMIARHHANWRLQAMQRLDRGNPEDLHYSSVVTIARKDAAAAKAILTRAIEEVRALVRASTPEEEIYCYTIDLFEV